MNETEHKEQIVITKLNLAWYTLFICLENIQTQALRIGDKKLCRLVDALIKYTDDKLPLQDGDIEKIYVVVEQLVKK